MLSYFRTSLRALIRDERGATMVEYGLMLALIAIVCITAVTAIGTNASAMFDSISSEVAVP